MVHVLAFLLSSFVAVDYLRPSRCAAASAQDFTPELVHNLLNRFLDQALQGLPNHRMGRQSVLAKCGPWHQQKRPGRYATTRTHALAKRPCTELRIVLDRSRFYWLQSMGGVRLRSQWQVKASVSDANLTHLNTTMNEERPEVKAIAMDANLTQLSTTVLEERPEENVEQWASQVKANIDEGDFGTRGEIWVAGQIALVIGVLAAVQLPDFANSVLGLVSIASGGFFIVCAVLDLGNDLTPWPKPVEANQLKTDGTYSLSRHPIYAGLIIGCGGLSVITKSYARLVLTYALFLLLWSKAGREEEFLKEKHGKAYTAYAETVPRFFPDASNLERIPDLAREVLPRLRRGFADLAGRVKRKN